MIHAGRIFAEGAWLPLPCDGGASAAVTPCQLSGSASSQAWREGQPHTLGLADLSGSAGEVSHGWVRLLPWTGCIPV